MFDQSGGENSHKTCTIDANGFRSLCNHGKAVNNTAQRLCHAGVIPVEFSWYFYKDSFVSQNLWKRKLLLKAAIKMETKELEIFAEVVSFSFAKRTMSTTDGGPDHDPFSCADESTAKFMPWNKGEFHAVWRGQKSFSVCCADTTG
jgi:hypothetical protein